MTSAAFTVRHHYRYVYTGPITALRQRLVMVPPARHGDQVLRSWSLDVRGISGSRAIEWQSDAFGNNVCLVAGERVERTLDFEARFCVERRAQAAAPEQAERVEMYRAQTALTAPDEAVHAAAETIRAKARTVQEKVERAHDWAARAIAYQVGVTGTKTPAAMALHLGRGVCQDYAHILLSVLRTLGIAARYVSGHLLGEGAPHAWVEVLLPDEVIAYDPTHHRRAGLNYVSVAVGRDFGDVTMTSGVFSGAASGRLHWSKQAEVVDLRRRDTAASSAA